MTEAVPLPDDLRNARDDVAKLMRSCDLAVRPALLELGRDAASPLSPLVQAIANAAAGLLHQIDVCAARIAPLRAELNAAARRRENALDRAVTLARDIHTRSAGAGDGGAVMDAAGVHWQLAMWGERLDQFLFGLDPRWEATAGITFEVEEAARQRVARSAARGRVRCDPAAGSLVIDGSVAAAGLRGDVLQFVLAGRGLPRPDRVQVHPATISAQGTELDSLQ